VHAHQESSGSGNSVRLLAALLLAGAVGAGGAYILLDGKIIPGPDDSVQRIGSGLSDYKSRPAEPGGHMVPHQERLVFERLHAEQAMGRTGPERLRQPPEAPLGKSAILDAVRETASSGDP
jgi:hypothetical protein